MNTGEIFSCEKQNKGLPQIHQLCFALIVHELVMNIYKEKPYERQGNQRQ